MNKDQTKRHRQLINRAKGLSGSYMPRERAVSIARKKGMNHTNDLVIESIRIADQSTKRKV